MSKKQRTLLSQDQTVTPDADVISNTFPADYLLMCAKFESDNVQVPM